jgi:hypothetical protein
VDGDGSLDIVLAKGRHWPLVNRVLPWPWPWRHSSGIRPRRRGGPLIFGAAG